MLWARDGKRIAAQMGRSRRSRGFPVTPIAHSIKGLRLSTEAYAEKL
jgi:hypothetical protein